MNRNYDAIVIGIGAMGSAACMHLARRGVKVLGLDQFGIPNSQGSSHGESRMTRMAYYEHADYVPLLKRAYDLWHQMENQSGQKLFHQTGGLYMGKPDGHVVANSLIAAQQHGLEHEFLKPEQLKERYPQFSLPADFVAIHETRAGLLLPERIVATQASLALRSGAELHGHEPVLEWEAQGGEVTVTTSTGTYHARHLLLTAGPWAGQLLRDLKLELRVTRQVMGWIWPKDPDQFELGKIPVWGIENSDGSLSYGFPILPGSTGIKIARHAPGSVTDPTTIDRTIREKDIQEIRQIAEQYLGQRNAPVLDVRTCLYTNSPDHHFIVDRHPHHANVHFACGFSGHGFKFASVIGEALADQITQGATALPIAFLSLNRFNA